jgi:hypothetical protein
MQVVKSKGYTVPLSANNVSYTLTTKSYIAIVTTEKLIIIKSVLSIKAHALCQKWYNILHCRDVFFLESPDTNDRFLPR